MKKNPSDFKVNDLGKALIICDFKREKEVNGIIYFKQSSFIKTTYEPKVTSKELPQI